MSKASSEFRAVCIIGWPAGHSRSPLIHNYWIKLHGLDAEYRREAVPPDAFLHPHYMVLAAGAGLITFHWYPLIARFTISSSTVTTVCPSAGSNSRLRITRRYVSRNARAPRRFCRAASHAIATSAPRVICRSIPKRLKYSRDARKIDDIVLRRLQTRLDAEEVRLSAPSPEPD